MSESFYEAELFCLGKAIKSIYTTMGINNQKR